MNDEVDVLAYVQSRFPVIRRGDAYNVHVHCPFHDEPEGKRGRLYINVDPRAEIPGLFLCHVCGAKGSLRTLKSHFGDVDATPKNRELDPEVRRALLEEAADYYYVTLSEHTDAIKWLKARGLTIETITKYQIGYADGGLKRHLRSRGFSTTQIMATGLVSDDQESGKIQDFFRDAITIPYRTSGNVTMIRGRAFGPVADDAAKYKTPYGYKSLLFNSDITWGADEIIVCEGEFDAILLNQMGFPAVAVPGAQTWQERWDGYVSEVKRLYVCFDPDDAGAKGAANLRERFGGRVKVMDLPRAAAGMDGADLTDWIVKEGHTAEDFVTLMRSARGSGLLFTIDDCIAEEEELAKLKGLQFNMGADLDLVLRPGMLPGQIAVVLAKTGVGKTIWLLNAMQRMVMAEGQEDLTFLFLTLEQTKAEYWKSAKKIHQFYNPFSDGRDAGAFWRPRLYGSEKNRLTEDDVHVILDEFEDDFGKPPDVVCLDYLGYWAQSFGGDRYSRTSDAIMSLKALAKERRLRIITPHQVGRNARDGEEPSADAARDAGVIEETADFLFTLWRPEFRDGDDAVSENKKREHEGEVWSRVGKSRHGGKGTLVKFLFTPVTLALLPFDPDDSADDIRWRAIKERQLRAENLSITWDDVVGLHRQLAKDEREF